MAPASATGAPAGPYRRRPVRARSVAGQSRNPFALPQRGRSGGFRAGGGIRCAFPPYARCVSRGHDLASNYDICIRRACVASSEALRAAVAAPGQIGHARWAAGGTANQRFRSDRRSFCDLLCIRRAASAAASGSAVAAGIHGQYTARSTASIHGQYPRPVSTASIHGQYPRPVSTASIHGQHPRPVSSIRAQNRHRNDAQNRRPGIPIDDRNQLA